MRIGIDVGGTNLAAGLVNADGKIVATKSVKAEADKGYDAMVEKLVYLVDELKKVQEKDFPNDAVTEVGVGVPGIISGDGAVVVNAPNIFWKNVPLKKDLEAKVGLPVYLANDATVAGIAENRFGSTKGLDTVMMYTLGTGVGGALIVNGQVIYGKHGVASEVGHMLSGENFYACNCGKNGCLETFSSATALIKKAQQRIAEGKDTVILEMAGGNPDKINAKNVIDAAKQGDEVGKEAFDIMVDKLAENIANTIDFIDPEAFAIGGGVAAAGDFLFDAIREAVKSKITYPELVEIDIRPAKLGNDAGIIGAAYIGDYTK